MPAHFQQTRGTSLPSPGQPAEVTAFQALPKGWQSYYSLGQPFLKDSHHFQPPLLCPVAVFTICDAFSELLELRAWSPGHEWSLPDTAATCSSG